MKNIYTYVIMCIRTVLLKAMLQTNDKLCMRRAQTHYSIQGFKRSELRFYSYIESISVLG